MKRSHPLIYCQKCKTNRAMKTLGLQHWKCMRCDTEHTTTTGGLIVVKETKKQPKP